MKIILQKSFTLLTLALISSCAFYGPVQFIGEEKPSSKAIKSCSQFIFGIPTNAENFSLQKLTYEEGLTEDDIHSIDQKRTVYPFFIYEERCLIANLTEKAAGVYKKKVKKVKSQREDRSFRYGRKRINRVNECEGLPTLTKAKCKEHFRK